MTVTSNKIVKLTELFPYIIIGGIATLIDWSTFTITAVVLNLPYQFGLIASYFTAGTFHYTANKLITFKCHSKQTSAQISLFIVVSLASLGLSMAILSLLINFTLINKVAARMLTTLIMLLPNYLFHKHLTFSKKIFAQTETPN